MSFHRRQIDFDRDRSFAVETVWLFGGCIIRTANLLCNLDGRGMRWEAWSRQEG